MKRFIFTAFLIIGLATSVNAEVRTTVLNYKATDGTPLKGYLAYDRSIKEPRPGVLLVHEWWGHNDYIKKRAEQLAAEGYVAFALDMYGGGKTANHPDQAGAFAKQASENMDASKDKFLSALDMLKQHGSVDPERIMAMGYCFGGAVVLNMARMGVDLDAVVSFHGSLGSNITATPGDVKAQVLVFTGADDVMVPADVVSAFENEMREAQIEAEVVSFPGVQHSFTNPAADKLGEKFGMPLAYNKEADEKSWEQMVDFFNDLFE